MTGPKHLWSGDWERESSAAAASRARLVPPEAPEISEIPPSAPAARLPWSASARRGWIAVGAAAAVVVAVAIILLSSGSNPQRTAQQAAVPPTQSPQSQPTQPFQLPQPSSQPTQPAIAAVPNQPPVHWLGMEIVAGQNGGVVIETVPIGSVGDQAGLDPGDLIVSVDGHAITTTPQLRGTIAGMRTGDQVSITVERGSSVYSTSFPLPQGP